ncbi:unnamed protein product [Brassica rapa subsp. narinosa]
MAKVDVGTPPNENFLKYLSSVMFLHLHWVDETVNQRISLLGVMFQRASSQLEILEWVKYGGTREEKKLLEYILANSKCLKRAGISMRYSKDCNDKMKKKLKKDLRSMYRVSASSELLFPAKIKWRSLALSSF